MVWHWFSRSQFSRLVQSLILAALDNGIPSLWGVFFMRNCSKTTQELPKCLLLILHTFAWEFSVDPALHRIYAHIRYIRPQEHTEWNEICDFRCSTVCDQVCDIYPPHAKRPPAGRTVMRLFPIPFDIRMDFPRANMKSWNNYEQNALGLKSS